MWINMTIERVRADFATACQTAISYRRQQELVVVSGVSGIPGCSVMVSMCSA